MGFWFFLSVVVLGNIMLKAYKLRLLTRGQNNSSTTKLENEVAALRRELARHNLDKRLEQLEETVFFGDFELKRQFENLKSEHKEA